MVLIDEPTKRHMCPVTLFLSMAIADGVIDDIDQTSDIASLCRGHPQSGWLLLRYKQDASRLPVLRRTGNKSRVISSCCTKPSVLNAMMQAQLNRAGHEETFATMLRDIRNATQREKRRKTAAGHVDTEIFLIGRGQAKCISAIPASELVTPLQVDTNTFQKPANLESPYPLPYVLEVQLKYDITRSMIVSYLFRSYAAYHAIPDILYPFVKAAESIAYEPYYADASPNASGGCPWCDAQLKR
jgi:hypothetical protein